MKHLSNADLRALYVLKASLPAVIEAVGLRVKAAARYPPDLDDLVHRINKLRNEVQSIIQDPRFELQVPEAESVRDGPYQTSVELTAATVVTTTRALGDYLNSILQLYLAPKTKELEQDPIKSGRVFIGHGRNAVVWPKIRSFIQDRCGLDPIVLELQPSTGLTVVEKLEKYGRLADYAAFVMTGDDRTTDGELRVRQNVTQEIGWFQGVLGRGRTALLVQRGIEIASNLGGIVYIDFPGDDVEAAFDRLRHELETAGLIEPAPRRRS